MEYTKGDWKYRYTGNVGGYNRFTITNGVDAVCELSLQEKQDETRVNAQLIASAPDLYEACKEAERTIEEALNKGTFLPNLNRAVRKALAKAEGEQQKPSPWGVTREEASGQF